jgi:Zn-dependent protease
MNLTTLISNPILFISFALGLLIAITIHEFSHAFAADRLGDPTPRSQGRLTLNPLAHLDPLGTISMLLIGFGWGKPVQFDPYNLENPRRDAAIISLAGPVSNLTLAFVLSLFERLISFDSAILTFLIPLMYINVMLAIFNLIPIGPLDGQKILYGILPRDLAYEFQAIMSKYGILLLLLFILPVFGGQAPIAAIISPIINFVMTLLTR